MREKEEIMEEVISQQRREIARLEGQKSELSYELLD